MWAQLIVESPVEDQRPGRQQILGSARISDKRGKVAVLIEPGMTPILPRATMPNAHEGLGRCDLQQPGAKRCLIFQEEPIYTAPDRPEPMALDCSLFV